MASVHGSHPVTHLVHVIEVILCLQIEIRLEEESAQETGALIFELTLFHDCAKV